MSEKNADTKKGFTRLEDLPGIGPKTADKLREIGIYDIVSLAMSSVVDLTERAGFSEETALKLIEAARKAVNLDFVTGDKVLEIQKDVGYITTMSKNLDRLLGGRGIPTQAITEAFGEFGSGKCFSKNTYIMYLEKNKIRIERIDKIYDKFKKRGKELQYDNGYYVKAGNIRVLSLNNEDGSIVHTKVDGIYREKVRHILRIRLENGDVIEVTENHPTLTLKDNNIRWVRSKDLRVGDYVLSIGCICDNIKKYEEKIDERDAYFLGLFIARGSKNPISIETSSEKIKDFIVEYIRDKDNYIPKVDVIKQENKKLKYRILFRRETIERILKGVCDLRSSEKEVPEEILMGKREIKEAFLAGYIDGSGYVEKTLVKVVSSSRRLVEGLKFLLNSLGILKYVILEKTIDGKICYNVLITGKGMSTLERILGKYSLTESLSPFESIKIQGEEDISSKVIENLIKEVFNYIKLPKSIENIESCTHCAIAKRGLLTKVIGLLNKVREEVSNALKHEDFDKLFCYINSKKVLEKFGYDKHRVKNSHTGERTLLMSCNVKSLINDLLNRVDSLIKTLQLLCNRNIAFLKVVKIEKIEYNDFVYDLVVPNYHNFVVHSGLVLHNTQLAFQLAIDVQLPPEQGGLEGECIWIDTEGTFSPRRAMQVAEALGIDPLQALKKIHYIRAYSTDHQMLIAERIPEYVEKKGINLKLIIVDSLTSLFRSEFTGRGMLAERQQKLNRHVHQLQRLADIFNAAVYVTNQVMAKPDIFFGDPTAPIGGHIVAHAMKYRIYLRKAKENKRIAKIMDAPDLPPGEAVFRVTDEGIRD